MSKISNAHALEAPQNDARLLLLSPKDNVFVLRRKILAGEEIKISGIRVLFEQEIGLGHKLAAKPVKEGEKIIKYGAPIGSAICHIKIGAHVHTHNIKSDYTATHTLEAARQKHAGSARSGEGAKP